jgi:hypothetical protein
MPERSAATSDCLLAVDLGLKTGLALYGIDGRLLWYRSKHFSSVPKLKQACRNILGDIPTLECLVAEGDRRLFEVWQRPAERRGIRTIHVGAERWRAQMLLPREQRGTGAAKRAATKLARAVIEWSGAKRPTSLRHDAAEAILIGLWGAVELGWLAELPRELRR